jgi:hypothetical protein
VHVISFRDESGRRRRAFAVRNLIPNHNLVDISRVWLPVVEALHDRDLCKAVRIELRRPRSSDRPHERIEWQIHPCPRVSWKLVELTEERDAGGALVIHVF